MKVLIINGPNMNMLGVREPEIYGSLTYADLVDFISEHAVATGVQVEFFQSNSEGAIIDAIQSAYKNADAIVINPAAYTHTSIAIADALRAVALPAVEVHLSDINSREAFRKISYTADACEKVISGEGFQGYAEALDFLSAR
ncbi:MAG: type II 3-dehydroquinate dehydratase [Clostridiales bacterium]|nr:type II 3-dehydroquinate dehydratase [Clostridiales bacterium]